MTIIPIVIGAFGTVTKGLLKEPGWLGIWRTSGDHSNDSINENGQNTEKSPGDLLSLKLQKKPSANADVKKSKVNNYIVIEAKRSTT